MDNYVKGETIDVGNELPFSPSLLAAGSNGAPPLVMKIKTGTYWLNIVKYADNKLHDESTRSVIFTGFGKACLKTVTCAEKFKKQWKGCRLHQISKATFRRKEEFWEPQVTGIDRLKVNLDTPQIYILFSKDEIDPQEPGYQDSKVGARFLGDFTPKSRAKKPLAGGSGQQKQNRWKRKEKKKRSPIQKDEMTNN